VRPQTKPERCPTCDSDNFNLRLHERVYTCDGGVSQRLHNCSLELICRDPWHNAPAPAQRSAAVPPPKKGWIACHVPPDQAAITANMFKEPEGERIRAELVAFLNRNKIVSILLDTENHNVRIDINHLPPEIKSVLTLWGSIFVRNESGGERVGESRITTGTSDNWRGRDAMEKELRSTPKLGTFIWQCPGCGIRVSTLLDLHVNQRPICEKCNIEMSQEATESVASPCAPGCRKADCRNHLGYYNDGCRSCGCKVKNGTCTNSECYLYAESAASPQQVKAALADMASVEKEK
jgi:hypothetical protein